METSPHARRPATVFALVILPAVLLVVLAPLAACKPRQTARQGGRTYTVRGQVIQLPDPAQPGSGLVLQHEAVDDFVGRDGTVVGMDPMAMPFPVAPGVSLAGIAPADVVEFDLNVDWKADPAVAITRVRKLPPGTKLVFRAAKLPR
jgi:Copper binding periplasmic protein CusF